MKYNYSTVFLLQSPVQNPVYIHMSSSTFYFQVLWGGAGVHFCSSKLEQKQLMGVAFHLQHIPAWSVCRITQHDILRSLWIFESDQSLQEKNWDSGDTKARLIFSSYSDNFVLSLPLFKRNEAGLLSRPFSQYFLESKHYLVTYFNKMGFQEEMKVC